MKKKKSIFAVFSCLLVILLTNFNLCSVAQNFNKASQRPFAKVPFMKKTPVIDGKINPQEWETLQVNGLLGRGNKLEHRQAIFWVGCDRQKLYIAIQSEVHPAQGILTRSKPSANDVAQVTMEDSIEIWLDPATKDSENPADEKIFRMAFNAQGAIDDMAVGVKDGKMNKQWRGKYEIASLVGNGIWTCELAIDLNSLGIKNLDFSHPWGMRICRNWKMPWTQGKWNPNTHAFTDARTMPLVQFVDEALIVQQLSQQNTEKTEMIMKVRVKNPGDKVQEAKVSLGNNELDQPRFYHDEKIELAPGAEKVIEYKLPVADPTTYQGVAEIKVKSLDGSVVFLRDYAWKMRPAEKIWEDLGAKKTVVFDFGYYPYLNKLKFRLDISSVEAKKDLTDLSLKITPHDSEKILLEKTFPIKPDSDLIERVIEAPELKDGTYDIKLCLKGKGKDFGKPMIETFERKCFPWEHNKIGISEEVIPPFTPIELDGKTVKTILREHHTSPMGLWSQVVSKGQKLLAAPMEFQIFYQGKLMPIKCQPAKFTMVKANGLKGVVDWQSGKINGKTEFEYDYDGMMKVTLEIKPQGKVEVDRFRMVIPMKEPRISLLHVVADGIRMTESKRVPEGQGIIWRSLDVNRNFLKAPFVPYIWLGGPERGICWFADTDREWLLDRKKDCAVIERNKDTLQLKLDFINHPVELDTPMKIIFGLQATPVKPMPKNWREWGETSYHPFKWMWFGAEAYWSGANVALWPYDKDFTILDKYREARMTGKYDKAFLEKLYKNFDYHKWYKPANKALEHFKRHVGKGYNRIAKSKPQAVTTYTNPTGALMCTPEWFTFQDEWSFDSYRLRDSRSDKHEILKWNETRTNLSESRMDFMLWQYQKLMKALMDGIYWDNMYPHSVMDPLNGDAYKLADGTIQPSVNIFALRKLVKRTAVLAHQLGKPRCNMVHMTTSNLIPVYSFADMTLDWEWKSGMDDFQDRFSTEYILTESTGLQTGCIPFVLRCIRGNATKERKEFVLRTFAGWGMVNELKTGLCHKALYDFGYGKPDCQVYNWWDSETPVKVTGVDAKYLLLKKGKRLMLIVCAYSGQGKTTVKILDKSGQYSSALDVESKQTIPVKDGTFSFELPKHDYRIFIISEK